jgi:hypothetical protein
LIHCIGCLGCSLSTYGPFLRTSLCLKMVFWLRWLSGVCWLFIIVFLNEVIVCVSLHYWSLGSCCLC